MWPKLWQQIWRWRAVLFTTPCVTGFVIAAGSAGLLQSWEWAALDRFFRLRPQEATDPRIVIVTIDESDINNIGQWPMSDALLARAIENLKARQPRVIGLDLYRDLPVEPGHQALVEVFESTPNLIGVEKVVGDTVSPPPTLRELDRVSIADLVLDADGKVRRALISVKPEDGKTRLSFGIRLALIYLQAEGITPEAIDAARQQLKLGRAVFAPLTANDGGYVRANAGGYQVLLNFRGNRENFQTISMTDVLDNRIPPEFLRNRIVAIGATGQSLNDLFLTPYSSGSPQQMPGVFIHANLTSQMLSGALEGRPFIRVWTEPGEWLWSLGWSLVGAVGSWTLLRANLFKKKIFPRWTFLGISILLAGGSLVASGYLAFLGGWWIPVASPLLSLAGSSLAIAAYHSRDLHRQSERRLAQFLEALPVGIGVIDATGKPYYINQRGQQLLGKGLVPDANPEELAEIYQNYIAGTDLVYPSERLPIVRALKGERMAVDDIEIHQGDKIIPIEASGTPIYDESGNIAYAIVTFADITERKKAEAERKEFTNQLYHLNQSYERFVPKEFLQLLNKKSIVDVKLGDNVQQDMSILFADIRDFTTLSEHMTPEDNFKFINAYLSRMEPSIATNNGFIDKYIGDAIMALFSGSPDDAVKAAISMLNLLADYNQTRGRPGRPQLRIGIGINTGSMMLGTVGGSSRMDGTVISDAVNVASRIEGLTKYYGVSLLISHNTFLRLHSPASYNIRLIDRVKIKGKSELVSVFEVFDADPPEIRAGKLETKTTFESALMYYSVQDLKQAVQLFEDCLRRNPMDRVAQTYFERVVQQLYD